MTKIEKADRWVPACGGREVPTKYPDGRTLLYCWNPKTGEHAYIDCETDMVTHPPCNLPAQHTFGYKPGPNYDLAF